MGQTSASAVGRVGLLVDGGGLMTESFIRLPPDGAGKRVRTIEETIGGVPVHSRYQVLRREPTFIAHAFDVVPAANAHMIALLNRNKDKVVRIYGANMYISSEAAVTGVLLKARLIRISATVALSGGTAVTPVLMDTAEPLPANIDIQTKPTSAITVVGEIQRFLLSGDEAVVTTWDADALASEVLPRMTDWLYSVAYPFVKPLTLRTDGVTHEGVSIQNLVGTVGNCGLSLLFTVDDQ